MAAYLKYPRGTRANFNTLQSASGLVANSLYWITDESRFAFATATNASVDLPRGIEDTAYGAGWNGDLDAASKNAVYDKIESMLSSAIVFHLNGGGSALAAANAIDLPAMPFPATVTGWRIVGNASGSAVIDIRRATYANYPTVSSIAGSEKPTLSSAQKNEDTNLTTWTTSLAQGDVLRAYTESASGLNWATVTLFVTKV